MKGIKTKNINLVLFSIIRQIRNGDKVRYDVLEDGEYFWIDLNRLSEQKNAIYIIQKVAEIKKILETGKKVKVEIYNKISFTIYKEEDFYYINNAELLLNYIVFEMSHDAFNLKIVLRDENDCENVLIYNDWAFSIYVKFKSVLFLDSNIEKEYFELVNGICDNIKVYLNEYKFAEVYLSNKKDKFYFKMVL